MATPKRARTTASTPRAKKATTTTPAQDPKPQQTQYYNVEDAIRFRAYQLFEQRGQRHGFDMEDWLRAEVEVVSNSTAQRA
jgi:hypothetical protein